MQIEKALAIVVRTSDWSETSRIATLFTREVGKARVLAKGGRRLRSSFETALDLLSVCEVVFIRKASGLDLLTEARLDESFSRLRQHLPTLYSAYYIAELLGDGTQDHDPHPPLFDAARAALRHLNSGRADVAGETMRFELAWLNELGYRPRLDACTGCGATEWLEAATRCSFSAPAGGLLCPACEPRHQDRRSLSAAGLRALRALEADRPEATGEQAPMVRSEVRQLLGQYVSFVLGRRPRLLTYLE